MENLDQYMPAAILFDKLGTMKDDESLTIDTRARVKVAHQALSACIKVLSVDHDGFEGAGTRPGTSEHVALNRLNEAAELLDRIRRQQL